MITRHFLLAIAWPIIAAVAVIVGLVVGTGSAGWVVGLVTGIVILAVGYVVLGVLAFLNIRSAIKNPDRILDDMDKLIGK
jgi:ABC-type transport system involved in cytochrome bd biosynthesis fused ATPase/permease subunit